MLKDLVEQIEKDRVSGGLVVKTDLSKPLILKPLESGFKPLNIIVQAVKPKPKS